MTKLTKITFPPDQAGEVARAHDTRRVLVKIVPRTKRGNVAEWSTSATPSGGTGARCCCIVLSG